MRKLLIFSILLSGCSSQMASRSAESNNQQIALFEEVRVALGDVRQALNSQKLDLSLLEEKMAKLEKRPEVSADVESRLAALERIQERAASDLHSLSRHAKETASALDELHTALATLEQKLGHESQKIAEVANLRSTISSLTKAMNAPQTSALRTHRVKSGDSLEKIARHYQTSVEEIKNVNGLNNNKILIGQELKIPN